MLSLVGAEPKFESWDALVKTLATIQAAGWIYRGLPSYSYAPVSKLERTLSAAGVPVGGVWRDAENRSIGFFKRRARRFLSETPADGDLLGWLTIMQHYGAPTRLTDWTGSPFVACYFAYERAEALGGSAALWMLHASACRVRFGSVTGSVCDHVGATPAMSYKDGELVEKTYPGRTFTADKIIENESELIRSVIEHESEWPLPLPIPRPDARMAAQQACFVCTGRLGSDPPILPRLLGPLADPGMEKFGTPPGYYMRKIELPHAWRRQALETLARMNITADTLFPGLDGVGRATETYLQQIEVDGAISIWDDFVLQCA
jgi:hypothetical protein